MAIRRKDTPLAPTVFDTIRKPQQDPRQRQDSIIAARRAEAAAKKAKSEEFWKKEQEGFNQRAKDKGMTPEQYSRKLEKIKKAGDAEGTTGDYSQKRSRNPCPGGRCRR